MKPTVRTPAVPIAEKRGLPIYETNPSIPSPEEIKRGKRAQIGDSQKGLIIDNGSGEVIGHGGAFIYQWEEVDNDRFVKLYLAGVKQAAGLSKAGLAVFEIVYGKIQDSPGKDTVNLSVLTSGMTKSIYYKGLRELLEKEFLYQSPYDGVFFINIRFMFNGDRLSFVKGFIRKSGQPSIEQADLFGEAAEEK